MVKTVFALDLGQAFGVENKFPTLGDLLSTILFNAYAVLGIIFLFLLILGGWGVIMGAGSGDQNKVAEGKKAIGAAAIGFVAIFLSYFIVKAIEVITGTNILNPGF